MQPEQVDEMAGRIRTIKPEFIEDEKLGSMTPVARLLFACSWILADDYGNFRANPKWVHSQVFCYDETTSVSAVTTALVTLRDAAMFTEYTVRGQIYYHINNWTKHQKVDKPGKPHCPGPEESTDACGIDSSVPRDNLAKVPDTLAPDLRPTTHDQEKKETTEPNQETPAKKPKPDMANMPKHIQRFESGMTGKVPGVRPDVMQLHDAWKSALGIPHVLRHSNCDDANHLLDAIKAHGLDDCLLVANHAPRDGMVNGTLDDKKAKHTSIRYIFGNEDTFSRILTEAKKKTGPSGGVMAIMNNLHAGRF
jgi:hypothetical protein